MIRPILLTLAIVVIGLALMTFSLPGPAAEFAISIERYRTGLLPARIQVDGEPWHYLVGGPADGETVLLLHGFGANKDTWTRFAGYLTERYRVVAPDLPGFGESHRQPGQDYRLPAQRERLHAFVAALGLTDFHLAGNSMGGHLSSLYAHAYPARVRSLTMFNTAGVASPIPSDMSKALEVGINPLLVDTMTDFDTLLAYVFHRQPFIPWPIKRAFALQAVANAEFNRLVFDAYKNDEASRLEPRLAEIEPPVLIVWGEYDRIIHVSSIEVMRPLLPSASIVIMRDTGHLPMIERPAEAAAHYRSFLERQLQGLLND